MIPPFRPLLLALALVALAMTPGIARAYYSSVNNLNAVILDNDPNGYQSSQSVSGLGGSDYWHVTVTLNVLGGFNGDYYARLSHNGLSAVLLNRTGRSSASNFGYADAGFGPDASANSFTLDDWASRDIHWYRSSGYTLNGSSQLTGQWQPDGRALDPESAASAFDTAPRSNPLGIFSGTDPNGLWTLFIADVSPLGQGVLQGWGLGIAVPEPSSLGLGLMGLLGGWLCRRAKR